MNPHNININEVPIGAYVHFKAIECDEDWAEKHYNSNKDTAICMAFLKAKKETPSGVMLVVRFPGENTDESHSAQLLQKFSLERPAGYYDQPFMTKTAAREFRPAEPASKRKPVTKAHSNSMITGAAYQELFAITRVEGNARTSKAASHSNTELDTNNSDVVSVATEDDNDVSPGPAIVNKAVPSGKMLHQDQDYCDCNVSKEEKQYLCAKCARYVCSDCFDFKLSSVECTGCYGESNLDDELIIPVSPAPITSVIAGPNSSVLSSNSSVLLTASTSTKAKPTSESKSRARMQLVGY